jgi:hypothetical protein
MTPKQFVLIEDTGDAYLVNAGDDTLPTLQSLVDGWIECATADRSTLGFEADVWVNEEGLFRNDFGINLVASFITGRQLVGPAVLARSSAQGETLGLTLTHIYTLVNDGLMLNDNGGFGYSVEEIATLRSEREEVSA